MANEYSNTAEFSLTDKAVEYEQKVHNNEINPFTSIYRSLVNLGADAVTEINDRKHVRISNFIALIYFGGSMLYLSFGIIWEKWEWFGIISGLSLSSIVLLVMNAFGKIDASRILFIVLMNFALFVSAVYIGPHAQGLNYFIISVVIPFLFFDIKKVGFITIGVVLPLLFIYAYEFVEPYFSANHFLIDDQILLARMGVILQFMLMLLAVYQFVFYNRKAEKELESSNAQMMLQTSELKRSNSDLEQFAYIISHDLKAPVRNISSFMNLLLNKYGSTLHPEAKEFVDYSHLGAKRLERLIDDVLAYCRIGTNLPKPIPVNLNDVINTIRFELRDKLTATGGQININRELPVVNNVHSSLMYHVFQNLISNGLKFNKSEVPTINISCTNSLNFYTFTVSDNGIGISKEYSATIFQMFKRLHNEHEYDGTGIGLAICKKIVEYYHGEVWFESEDGKGTTFHFTVRKF
ncbi:MAG: ATP-binding protein [Bacteroidetes bacterium]|nr:ATP-binding protein [Bacteroidota bacterium]